MPIVKCLLCNKNFERTKEPCIQIGNRYVHKKCTLIYPKKIKELLDREDFYACVKTIYGPKYNYQMINRQAENFIETYGYTWYGMTKSLQWFYEVQDGSKDKSNDGVGIIPYVYDKAKEYYKTIAETQKKNSETILRQPVIEVKAKSPRGWKQPPRLFDWEDDDE